MNICLDGFNENIITLESTGSISVGNPVKMAGNKVVAVCGDGDDVCGKVMGKESDGCVAVKLTGVMASRYSGTAPTVGFNNLVGNGKGGIKVVETGGQPHLVLNVDTTFKVAEFVI